MLQVHEEVERDSGIPAITRGIACVGKTSSAPTGPLSAGDGVDGMSSVTISLASGDGGCGNILLIYGTKGSL